MKPKRKMRLRIVLKNLVQNHSGENILYPIWIKIALKLS
jgi:hypothetical protein